MLRMGRRRRGGSHRSESNVPSGTVAVSVDLEFTGNAVRYVNPPEALYAPIRPTSADLMFASTSPVSWQVAAFSGGLNTVESMPFVTCGNSIRRQVRNSTNSPFSIDASDQKQAYWAVTASGPGKVVGIVRFSMRGTIDPSKAFQTNAT